MEDDIFPCADSDHSPIFLSWDNYIIPIPKTFHFEKFWLYHPDFMDNIRNWWIEEIGTKGTSMYGLQLYPKN
jgi:hypothetical protein